jgi:hypothetical protein
MRDHPNAIIITADGALQILAAIPNIGRLVLAAIFVGSYMMVPLYRIILTFWEHVVESDKPMFTLLFGSVAAAAKAIEAVIHSL